MKSKRLFYILLIAWMLLDLFVAISVPVHPDEVYYAMYGKFLDWGYYDHPPMVALLTFFSSLLFKGSLSIRFLTVLLHGATVWLLWRTLSMKEEDSHSVKVFFIVSFSMIMFSAYGVITTPDAPLLFFAALFFFLYEKYLEGNSWCIAFGLGVVLACMLYSKYMAVLVLACLLLSNLKVLKDPKIWMAGLLAALLFVPHALWQYRNGFPSMQYHLVGRNEGFSFKYILEYWPNQLMVFNPVCLGLALFFCWKKRKTENLFEKFCLYTMVGFVFFFWLMTLKGHAEPHWTTTASIPMILLLSNQLQELRWRKWLRYGILPVALLMLLARVVLPVLSIPSVGAFKQHQKMEAVHQYCGDTPVVFLNSFQEPALYSYYTARPSVVLSSVYGRRTQYDIWQWDKELQGKPVFAIGKNLKEWKIAGVCEVDAGSDGPFFVRKYNSFQGTNRIEITVNQYDVANDTLILDLTMANPYSVPFDFHHPEFATTLLLAYLFEHYVIMNCPVPEDLVIPAGGEVSFTTKTKLLPDVPFVLCVDNEICRAVNSKPMSVSKIKN